LAELDQQHEFTIPQTNETDPPKDALPCTRYKIEKYIESHKGRN
jgi:hypothetical protein